MHIDLKKETFGHAIYANNSELPKEPLILYATAPWRDFNLTYTRDYLGNGPYLSIFIPDFAKGGMHRVNLENAFNEFEKYLFLYDGLKARKHTVISPEIIEKEYGQLQSKFKLPRNTYIISKTIEKMKNFNTEYIFGCAKNGNFHILHDSLEKFH